MSGLDVKKIRDSFDIIKPIAANVADKFYEILFTDFPSSRNLFQGVDLEMQQKALINSLAYVVEHLEDSTKLKKYLNDLGNRHLKYGTEEIHFEWVGCSLLKTLNFFFAEKWTDALEREWVNAFLIISNFMKEGMKPTSEATDHIDNQTPETEEKLESIDDNSYDEISNNSNEDSDDVTRINQVADENDESLLEDSSNVVHIGENKSVQIPLELQNKIKDLVKSSIDHYIEEEIIKALNEKINIISEEDVSVHLKKIVNG
ncbi:MAG: globin domain-containing protein [Oligoflexales bacterium]